MVKVRLFLICTFCILSLFISSIIQAGKPDTHATRNIHNGFYIDANLGYFFAERSLFNSSNRDGIGFNGNFGYQFNPYVGAEIGYNYLNNLKGSGIHWGILALKGILPINKAFDLFAKLGVALVLNRSSQTGLYLAVGGSYFVIPCLAFNVQLSGETAGVGDFGLIAAGLSYYFK